ncbi:MAG: hypothetical protein ABSG33_04655 [Candidatus Bathyarchaeia archaeon]|jgi:hypothetical protein
MGKLESELSKLGFVRNRTSNWSRKHDIVQIVRSSEHPKVRVTWREYWKDFLAIIFDYSKIDGPVCIVPTKDFFNAPFVSQKRREQAYVNSGNYWSQVFVFNDPLPRLILSFSNRWDVLGGQRGEVNGWPETSMHPPQLSPNPPKQPPNYPRQPSPVNFEGLLKAFSDKHLLHLYCDLMKELRERHMARTNNLVADYGEKVVAELLNLKLSVGSNKGYDAIDEKSGVTYQIKSRQATKHNGASSKQLGAIKDLDEKLFDYLIAVIFNEFMEPKDIWQIPFGIIRKYSTFSERQNGHILILAGDILQDEEVKKLL